jgi:response regulator RpfG family c-di-GMP phosphodiesterase
VYHHHERLDGSDTGGHLRVRDPDAVRIVTVADIFDALTTDRSYRAR